MSVLRASRQRHPQRAALQDGLVLRRALAAFGVLVILFLSMGFAVSPASAQTTTTSPGGGTSSGPGANVGVEGDIIANGPNSPEVGGPTNPTTPPPGSNPEAEAEKTEEQKNREAFEQNAGTESVGQTGDGSGGITSEIIRRATESIASFVGSIAASAVRSVIFGFIYNAADANVYSDCSTTSSDCWLNAQVDMMRTIALPVMLPLLVLAVIQGVIKGSLFKILKVLALAVPIAIVGSTLAQPAIQLLLYIADDMSAVFEQSASNDIGRGAENITRYMLQPSVFGPQAGGSGIILHLLLGLGIILSTLGVMVVLLLRTASIYIATMFMPIAFVMLVWPATSRYFFKLVQFLAAIIFSKVVMMAGLALAFSVLATIGVADGSVGSTAVDGGAVADVAAASTAATTEASRQEVYSQVILFIAMMLLVTFSPGALMKFLDNFSLGEGSSAVTSHLSAPDFTNAIIFLGRIESIYGSSKIIGSSIRTRSENAQWAKAVSKEEYLASAIGIDKRDGSDYFTGYELVESDVAHIDDPLERERLMTMSRSEDFNEVLLANVASEAARNGWEVVDIHKDLISEGAVVDGSASIHGVELLRSEGSQAGERTMAYFADATTREGVPITTIDPRHLKVVAEAAADKGIKNTTVLTGIMPNTTEETDKRFIEIAKQASALSGSSVIVTATNASQGDLSSQLRNRAHSPREYQQTAAANARRHADFAPRNNFPGGFVPTGGGAPGGSGPGGGAPGGSSPGGSGPGGGAPGGSTPGGSTPGGSTPGGTPGGSSPGGASRFTPPPTPTPSTGSPPYAGFTPPPSGGQSSGGQPNGGSSSGGAPFVPFVPRPKGGGRSSNGGSSPRPSRSQPVRSQPNPTPNPRKSFFSRPNAGSNPAPPPRSAPPPKASRFGRKPKSGVPKAPKPNRRIRPWT